MHGIRALRPLPKHVNARDQVPPSDFAPRGAVSHCALLFDQHLISQRFNIKSTRPLPVHDWPPPIHEQPPSIPDWFLPTNCLEETGFLSPLFLTPLYLYFHLHIYISMLARRGFRANYIFYKNVYDSGEPS